MQAKGRPLRTKIAQQNKMKERMRERKKEREKERKKEKKEIIKKEKN